MDNRKMEKYDLLLAKGHIYEVEGSADPKFVGNNNFDE